MKDIRVAKGQYEILSDAAIKAVNSLTEMEEQWIPGMQNGRAVAVYFTIPIKFSLAD